MVKRRVEPLLWLLFSSGGLAAALLLPVPLLLFGLVFPAGWGVGARPGAPARGGMQPAHPHRPARPVRPGALPTGRTCSVRYTLYYGLQLKHLGTPIILGCYGSALVGSVTAGYVLLIACKRQQVRDVCPPRLPS
jgi:fumarate reductase subunit D